MKRYVKYFLFFLILLGCDNNSKLSLNDLVYEEIESNWKKNIISNIIVYNKSNMEPFTGKIDVKNYKGEFKNGQKIGIHREYNYYGDKIIFEGNYKNGIPSGIHKNWNDLGQLIMKVNYENGKKNGLSKRWNDDGDLIKVDYNENEIISYLFNSSLNSTIEGEYESQDFGYYNQSKERRYKVFIKKIDNEFCAIMINNYKNPQQLDNIIFTVGDIKVSFYSYVDEKTKFNYKWMNGSNSKIIGEAFIAGNKIELDSGFPLYRLKE